MLVCGEAGMGKSRLLLALKERASNDPESWLTELRCSQFHRNSSFYPASNRFPGECRPEV